MLAAWLLVGPAALTAAAADAPDRDPRTKAIYGRDDRLDEYQVHDPDLLALGDSTVILIDAYYLTDNGNGTWTIWYPTTAGEDYDLCPREPFADQPAPGVCTGFLAGPNLVATAGHCVATDDEAATTAIVFGFVMRDRTSPVMTVPASDVYFGKRVYARSDEPDWGVIELDRPVVGHTPLAYRTSGKIPDGEPLVIIGHPLGMPRKYAAGATVQDNHGAGVFVANLDAFEGSSGSPVFSTRTGLLEGILVNGAYDFDKGLSGCTTLAEYANGSGREGVTRITFLADVLASGQTPKGDHVVEPRLLDFGSLRELMTIRVRTTGGTAWNFHVTPAQDWIAVEPASGTSSGPADQQEITIRIDRSQLPAGVNVGRVDVDDTSVAVVAYEPGLTNPIGCGAQGMQLSLGLVGFGGLVTAKRRRGRTRP